LATLDLKKGEFKAEYAGKMNFYLAVVDDKLRHDTDAPSIGLILCQDRNQIVAEYALRGKTSPIGVSEYELTRALPANLRSALPTVEEIESELGEPPKTASDSQGNEARMNVRPARKSPKKGRNR
jgi:hypothetical protein